MNWQEILLIIYATIVTLTNLGCFIILLIELLKKIKMDKKMENRLMQKQEKVLLKCIVKNCNSKVLVTLKTVNIEDSVAQFFNMCYFHKKQFKNKVKEIKNKE